MGLNRHQQEFSSRDEEVHNSELLKENKELIDRQKDGPAIYHLSKELKSAIAEAREQIKQGEFLSDDEATKEIEKWTEK